MFRKIVSHLPEIDSTHQMDFVKKAINQNYQYLNESSRAIVFMSADKNYVIKLFKSPEGIEKQFRSWGMDLGEVSWSPKPGDALGSAELLFKYSLDSYNLAYNKLREETRLIYVHTDQTNTLNSSLKLDGKKYNADKVQFLMQDSIDLFGNVIDRLMEYGQFKEAQEKIDELLSFIIRIWQKGITEDTFNFHDNYGFSNDGNIVMVDVGEFHNDPEYLKYEINDKKIIKKESFEWLTNNHSDLADYMFKQVMKRFNLSALGN